MTALMVIHDRILAQYLCPQILIMDTNFQPAISKNARGHYRQQPLEFKRALVVLSLEPGASVAREHGVNANQVFSGRPLYQQGRLGVPAMMRADGLLPVALAPSAAPAPNNADADDNAGRTIVRELGEVGVRIEGHLTHLSLLTRKN